MKYQKMKLIDAHAYVKQKRPLVRPNAGFWKYLVEYEKKLFQKNSISMVESKFGVYSLYYIYTIRLIYTCFLQLFGTLGDRGDLIIDHTYFLQ